MPLSINLQMIKTCKAFSSRNTYIIIQSCEYDEFSLLNYSSFLKEKAKEKKSH